MNFSPYYNETDKQKVLKINAELANRNITPAQAGVEFNDGTVETILAGIAEFEVNPRLEFMWDDLFGENVSPDEVASDNVNYNDTYTDEDKANCSKIRILLAGPKAKNKGLVAAKIAKQIGMKAGLFSQVVNGKYSARPTEHLLSILNTVAPKVFEQQPEPVEPPKQNIILRYGDVPYVETSISRLIWSACENAKTTRRFAIFAGQAGIGKSSGIKHYCDINPSAICLRGGEMISDTQIINQLCKKLGISRLGSKADKIEKITSVLSHSDRIILLDEADKCKASALHPLRTISDEAIIGVVLVGNLRLKDKLSTEEDFELIYSRRCFNPKPIGEVSIKDIQILFTELTQNTLPLEEANDSWWVWLHKRVAGSARNLVENLLPHLLKFNRANPAVPISRTLINQIYAQVLDESAV
jgi:DNA transposition AAA+ family ATPase